MEHLSEREEEILETLWIEIVELKHKPNVVVLRDEPELEELVEKGFIDTNKEELLTAKGFQEAERCLRRHRLAERLLADILEVKDQRMHEASCKFEHGLHDGVEDSICTLLGHPHTCPHGKPIPQGPCCKNFTKETHRLVVPLKELHPNQTGRINYINTQDSEALKKLIAMGILPGNQITLLHRFPSYVFEMGKSHFAIDKDLAENIYVLVLKRR